MTAQLELAERYMKKAGQDQLLAEKLIADQEIADELIGFHCQQAAEKIMKALLASRSLRIPRTHDMVKLMALLKNNGCPVPEKFESLNSLAPFAVEYRYDFFIEEKGPALSRSDMLQLVKQFRQWAEKKLS